MGGIDSRRSIMQSTGNTILVTGGGSGIGRALAESFHRLGNRVIIAGRRQDALDAVTAANPGMTGMTLDVADAGAIRAFAAKLTAEHPDLNVVIQNAGMMSAEAPDAGIDLDIAEATVVTNLLGPIRLSAALLPHLKGRPGATIVTVSSGLAFVPLAATPTYCATKAAIHSWSVSMRRRLKADGIEVIELVPPAVQTDLMPGHAEDPNAMPLADYIAEVMAQFATQPTPPEIGVKRLAFLRNAEREGRFEQTFETLNSTHR
jgi:uncharacterized oxidoreductase